MKCKHDFGWCIERRINVFIFKNNKVEFDFQGFNKKFYKLKVRCNYPDCNAKRNVYIIGKVTKWGKIKNERKKE